MRCQNCGYNNDEDAEFCVNCGTNLGKRSGIGTSTKLLIVVVVVLVLGLGVVSGMLLMSNQTQSAANASANGTTNNSGQTSIPTDQSNTQYKTFSNGIVNFQYPFSWDVLPNNANSMVLVGLSGNPSFSVYDESKYGYKSLSDYVSGSKKERTKAGNVILSEQSITVDGLPAYEIVYQYENLIQQMVLVEKSPGSKYYVLVGVDTTGHFDQSRPIFNKIVNNFEFLS